MQSITKILMIMIVMITGINSGVGNIIVERENSKNILKEIQTENSGSECVRSFLVKVKYFFDDDNSLGTILFKDTGKERIEDPIMTLTVVIGEKLDHWKKNITYVISICKLEIDSNVVKEIKNLNFSKYKLSIKNKEEKMVYVLQEITKDMLIRGPKCISSYILNLNKNPQILLKKLQSLFKKSPVFLEELQVLLEELQDSLEESPILRQVSPGLLEELQVLFKEWKISFEKLIDEKLILENNSIRKN
jgi:hypothetical protein